MKKDLFHFICLFWAVFVFVSSPEAFPCSTFVLYKGDGLLFGRTFDFHTGSGAIMVNPRGLKKTALAFPGENPASWTAQFGSVTFNQVGREFPMGGMNEAGLVVEMMWHFQAVYPERDGRPGMMELQWIQYLLDTCASIDDVARAIEKVRIMPMGSQLHFHMLDRNGNEAIVEFINGKTVCYRGRDLPIKALTNMSYAECLEALSNFQGFGGAKPLGTTINDPDRFAALAAAVEKPGKERKLLARAWAILDEVHCNVAESPTQWRFVYNPLKLEIHIRTLKNLRLRKVCFRDFSFDCAAGAKVLDLDSGNGDLGRLFSDYSPAFNETLVRKTFAAYRQAGFQKDMPDFYLTVLAAYPNSVACR